MGFFVEVWNLFLSIKSFISELYCWVGNITAELPLSAVVIMASFSLSLV